MKNNLNELLTIIENKNSVVDIISDYISLEKKGNNFVGLCPFHADSHPSMSVSPTKGIFKCFVCGAGGGPINFVQNYEGITFIDAVKKVSDKLELDWKPYITSKQKIIKPEIIRGWEINEEAHNFFKYNLKNSDNKKILKYIKSRDLNEEIIDKFSIGFSGDGSSLSKFLLNKGFSEDEIIKYGLGKRKEDTTLIDYFINRLTFAIQDSNGNIIGFSGRIIDDSNYAKYLNSPETSIFKKSSILYNLHNAKIKANLKKEIIIVEGFMDVIALYKSGIENVIATMGTAFTNVHSKIVEGITKNIILAFDSDSAGINALINSAKTLIKDDTNVYSVFIPHGKDFDELYKNGKDEVMDVLNSKVEFLTFYKNKIYSAMEGAEGKKFSELLKILLETLSLYSDEFIVERTLSEISEKFHLSTDLLNKEFNKHKITKNIEDAPYIQEYVPQAPILNEVKNIKIKNKNNKLIRLFEQEELILAYAIQNNDAFKILSSYESIFPIEDNNLYNAWLELKENKLNGTEINDAISLQIINNLLNKDISQKLKDNLITISNFNEYINKNIALYKMIKKENLKVELLNATSAEDKIFINEIIRKMED